jgi:hypothetical protein
VWDGTNLSFPDHDRRVLDNEMLLLLEFGGGPSCRCAELRMAWESLAIAKRRIPDTLQDAFDYRLESYPWLKATGEPPPRLIEVPLCLGFVAWWEREGRQVKPGVRPVAEGVGRWHTKCDPSSGRLEREPELFDLYHFSQTVGLCV